MTSTGEDSKTTTTSQRATKMPRTRRKLEIAVIGAGISGLVCARLLSESGYHVRVFDKARGPGGRMATRRTGPLLFDHGAQYFTVRDPHFRRWVESWEADGLAARWEGKLAVVRAGEIALKDDATERWVGVPGMSAICRHLATGLDVNFGYQIVLLARSDGSVRCSRGFRPCAADRSAACGVGARALNARGARRNGAMLGRHGFMPPLLGTGV